MPSSTRPHYDTYRDLAEALRRKVKADPDRYPCHRCHTRIDTKLDWRHPMSYTYDHDVPLAQGGNPRGPGKPAHRSCNSRRGDDSNSYQHITATNRSNNWLDGPQVR